MRSGGPVCMVLFSLVLVAGCIQLPGIHIISNSPDPVIGQWIGGDPPASDLHMIFYENQTFFSVNFFLNRGEETDTGTWTRIEPGRYSTESAGGEITNWTYDPFEDSLFIQGFPQRKYFRYKG